MAAAFRASDAVHWGGFRKDGPGRSASATGIWRRGGTGLNRQGCPELIVFVARSRCPFTRSMWSNRFGLRNWRRERDCRLHPGNTAEIAHGELWNGTLDVGACASFRPRSGAWSTSFTCLLPPASVFLGQAIEASPFGPVAEAHQHRRHPGTLIMDFNALWSVGMVWCVHIIEGVSPKFVARE